MHACPRLLAPLPPPPVLQEGLVAPIPEGYRLSANAAAVLNSVKAVDQGQQITLLRNFVVDMGFDPAKGEGQETLGCPLYSHPAQLEDNRDCVLCMTCLKACPHRSVEFNLRPPGIELWTTHQPRSYEVALMFRANAYSGREQAK